MNRLVGYLVGGLFFFSTVFTGAYLLFPDFRAGAHLFAGVILGQFVAAIVGLATREVVRGEAKEAKKEEGNGA